MFVCVCEGEHIVQVDTGVMTVTEAFGLKKTPVTQRHSAGTNNSRQAVKSETFSDIQAKLISVGSKKTLKLFSGRCCLYIKPGRENGAI